MPKSRQVLKKQKGQEPRRTGQVEAGGRPEVASAELRSCIPAECWRAGPVGASLSSDARPCPASPGPHCRQRSRLPLPTVGPDCLESPEAAAPLQLLPPPTSPPTILPLVCLHRHAHIEYDGSRAVDRGQDQTMEKTGQRTNTEGALKYSQQDGTTSFLSELASGLSIMGEVANHRILIV